MLITRRKFEKLNITDETKKIDTTRAKEALKQLKPAAAKLRADGRAFLVSLN